MNDALAAQIQATFSQKLMGMEVAKKNSEFVSTLQSL
jgi:hypothetical protein